MLNQADLSFYLGCLQFLSKYCLIPFDIRFAQTNSSSLIARPAGNRKRYVWNCFYAYGIARTCHSCITFVSTLTTKVDMSGYEFGSGLLCCILGLAMVILTWFAAVRTPEITALVLRSVFPTECTSTHRNENVKKGNRVQSFLSRWKLRGFSTKEILIIYFPQCIGIFLLGMQLMIATFSSGLHVYQRLPDSYKNPLLFCLLFAHEYVLWVSTGTICITTTMNILLFFEKVNEELIREIKIRRQNCGQSPTNLQELMRCKTFFKETQLVIKLFNTGHSAPVYCIKLGCLALTVLSGYLGVRHFSESSIVSILLVSFTLYVTFAYAITFSRAFSIPGYMKSLKKELCICVRLSGIPMIQMKLFEKQMGSISEVAIQVGAFHTMERESTPIFVHFVVTSVTSLLITI